MSLPRGQKVPETVGEGGLASKALRSEGAADRDRAASSTRRSLGPPCRGAGHQSKASARERLRDLAYASAGYLAGEKPEKKHREQLMPVLTRGMPGQRVGVGHHGSEGAPQVTQDATGHRPQAVTCYSHSSCTPRAARVASLDFPAAYRYAQKASFCNTPCYK